MAWLLLCGACIPAPLGNYYEVLPCDPGAERLRVVEFRKYVQAGADYRTWDEPVASYWIETGGGNVQAGPELSARAWMRAKSGQGLRWPVEAEPFSGGEWCLRLETGYGEWRRLVPPAGRFRGSQPVWTVSTSDAGPVVFAGERPDSNTRSLRFWRLELEPEVWSPLVADFSLEPRELPVHASACSASRVYVVLKGGASGTRTLEGDFARGTWREAGCGFLLAADRDGSLLDRYAERRGDVFRIRRVVGDVESFAKVPALGAEHLTVRPIPGMERMLLEYSRGADSYPRVVALASFRRALAVIGASRPRSSQLVESALRWTENCASPIDGPTKR